MNFCQTDRILGSGFRMPNFSISRSFVSVRKCGPALSRRFLLGIFSAVLLPVLAPLVVRAFAVFAFLDGHKFAGIVARFSLGNIFNFLPGEETFAFDFSERAALSCPEKA
jgi:hypothetical protein